MKLLGLKHLVKLKNKNKGNTELRKAIDCFIKDIEEARWKTKEEILAVRRDADCVHSEGFYFFDIHIHRTITLVEYQPPGSNEEDKGTVNVLWVGSHKEYDRLFRNNKNTIEKWLRDKGLIE